MNIYATPKRKPRPVLYISYDGVLEPLGQSQVLAYLERLAPHREFHLLTFEKASDWAKQEEREHVATRLRLAGVGWHPLRYHKRPSALATSWDIAAGIAAGRRLIVRHGIGIVHARSYVPSVMALALKRLTSTPFIFDMRGFWADERVEGGLWRGDGALYRIAKHCEREFLLGADHVVSLTHAGAREIARFDYTKERLPPVSVIPTCTDLSRFRLQPRSASPDDFTLGYVGSAGTWYRFDAAATTFRILTASRPRARFLIINRGDHDYIRHSLVTAEVPLDRVEIVESEHRNIPALIARMDAGVFFYKQSYSRSACSPTKLGEFWGCGVPCITSRGVGDIAEIVAGERGGIVVEDLDKETLAAGVEQLLSLCAEPQVRERCAAAARRHFSLEDGAQSYADIYAQLSRI